MSILLGDETAGKKSGGDIPTSFAVNTSLFLDRN
jgi:hypothetical protein